LPPIYYQIILADFIIYLLELYQYHLMNQILY